MAEKPLTFATFNVLNLQDVGQTMYRPGDGPTEALVNAKVAWIAKFLAMLGADVIGFQEVWSKSLLERCFEEAGLRASYDIAARDAPGAGKPQVALACRAGWLQAFEWIPDFPEDFQVNELRESRGAREEITVTIRRFSRPVLRAAVKPAIEGADEIAVFVAHLKSKAPTELSGNPPHEAVASQAVSHIRRMMEAGALRVLLDSEMAFSEEKPLSPTVVMGDLNDGSHAVSTEVLTSRPSYKLFYADRRGQKSDKGLYSVETLQQYRSQMDVYYTYIHKNKFESLDHILVSEEFYDHSRKRRWSFKESRVYNDHLIYDKDDEEKSLIKPDHGVVRATFVLDPAEE